MGMLRNTLCGAWRHNFGPDSPHGATTWSQKITNNPLTVHSLLRSCAESNQSSKNTMSKRKEVTTKGPYQEPEIIAFDQNLPPFRPDTHGGEHKSSHGISGKNTKCIDPDLKRRKRRQKKRRHSGPSFSLFIAHASLSQLM